jgi:hypothetical protein
MKKELKKLKHARSAMAHPDIDLEPDEYVVLHIKRAQVGVVGIWVTVGLLIFALCLILIVFAQNNNLNSTLFTIDEHSMGFLRLAVLAVFALIIFGGFIAQSVYNANQLYITNYRAIQKSRTSLFANSTNIIKLSRIEDVSFRQKTLFEHLFSIGTLRMSTVGDETTYTFNWLATPQDEVKIISHLVYENKHGQPPKDE